MSAKEIKRSAQRELVHQIFRDTLFTVKTVRVYNYNIVSKGHTKVTEKQTNLHYDHSTQNVFSFSTRFRLCPLVIRPLKENLFTWTPSGPIHTMKLIIVRPNFNRDFYSGPTQKQSCKKKKLLVAESVNVPLLKKKHLFYLMLQKNDHLKNSARNQNNTH